MTNNHLILFKIANYRINHVTRRNTVPNRECSYSSDLAIVDIFVLVVYHYWIMS